LLPDKAEIAIGPADADFVGNEFHAELTVDGFVDDDSGLAAVGSSEVDSQFLLGGIENYIKPVSDQMAVNRDDLISRRD
jgi:hypothetical protein